MKDLDSCYDEALHNLKTRPKLLEKHRSEKEKEAMKQDYYKSIRTHVLMIWTLTNVRTLANSFRSRLKLTSPPQGILVACILNGDVSGSFSSGHTPLKIRIYMIIILGFVTFSA